MHTHYKDEVVLIGTIILITFLLIYFDTFEYIYLLTRKYEHYQLDEIIIISFAILTCVTIYALKKYFDLKEAKNKLYYCSKIDSQTKLKNRSLFFEIPENEKKYLVLINIINFTIFNKHLGFKKGDELLKNAAIYLKEIVYKELNESLYRVYGDEFAFYYDKEDIKEVLISIKSKFENKLFDIDSYKFYLHINIAYSSINPKYLTTSEALLETRKSIENSITLYTHQKIYSKSSLEMLNIIRESLDTNNFIPVYQGIYNNNSKKIYKYETLARIKKNDELISPYKFIDISKKFKLYHKITRRIVECAFRDFKDTTCEFSINLSYIDIVNEVTSDFIFDMLKQNSNTAERLTVEFLETENIVDYNILIAFTKKIREYGCKIALDDFGSGYSNWDNILKLRPDFIKIDGSIIQNLLEHKENIDLIKLIVNFSKINNIKTIAEFVDSQELANLIIDLQIDYAQGFLYSKPKEKKYIQI